MAHAQALASIKGTKGALMYCENGKWVMSVCAWMTAGKMPTLEDCAELVSTDEPVNVENTMARAYVQYLDSYGEWQITDRMSKAEAYAVAAGMSPEQQAFVRACN